MRSSNFRYPLTVKKIWRDLWQDPTRSLVVIATIVVSVFLLGTIYLTWLILPTTLSDTYRTINPAHGILYTAQPFDDLVIADIRKLPEVAEAEGRYLEIVSVPQPNADEKVVHLFSLADYNDIRLDKVLSDFGSWPPDEDSILIERSANAFLFDLVQPEAAMQETLALQFADGRQEQLPISGQGYDFIQYPAHLANNGYVYLSQETLDGIRGQSGFNMLLFQTSSETPTEEEIQATAVLIEEKLKAQGFILTRKELRQPNTHPLSNLIESSLLILGSLGILGMVLSAILILNTITSLQASQVRQVGIMKTIGALPNNLIIISLAVIFGLGLTAVIIAFPLSILGAWLLSRFGASLLNLELTTFYVPTHLILFELAIGLLFPLIIALMPVIKGSAVTVREAISDHTQAQFGFSRLDNLLNQLQRLPIFVRYGLRNILRHKLRTLLVVLVLSVAAAIFMTTISLRASLLSSIDNITAYWQQDIQVLLSQPARAIRVERILNGVEDVVLQEGRFSADAFLYNAKQQENRRIVTILGLSPTSSFIRPTLLEGRWLTEDDRQAIVLNINALHDSAGITLNEWVTLEINGRFSQWQVVGISGSQMIGNSDLMSSVAYVSYEDLATMLGQVNRVSRVVLQINPNSTTPLAETSRQIEERLEQAGIHTSSVHTYIPFINSLHNLFVVPISLTVVMTFLFAVVGGLGLMGMMGLNVLQRTREIGVIRTIGSTDLLVAGIIITEGIVMGFLSWGIGLLLALPLSRLLGNAVGQTFINTSLAFSFPPLGILFSLIFMLFIATVACLIPARNASSIIIRNALSYE